MDFTFTVRSSCCHGLELYFANQNIEFSHGNNVFDNLFNAELWEQTIFLGPFLTKSDTYRSWGYCKFLTLIYIFTCKLRYIEDFISR